jgi:hypothetical protein
MNTAVPLHLVINVSSQQSLTVTKANYMLLGASWPSPIYFDAND